MELQVAVEALDKLQPLLPRQAALAVADDAQFIFYRPGERIDLGICPGDPLREGMLTWQAVQERRALAQMMESNPFHVPYFAASVPITDGDEVKGCVTAIYPPAVGLMFNWGTISNIVPVTSVDRSASLEPAESAHPLMDAEMSANRPFLIGKAEDRWIPVPLRDIAFVESQYGKTWLHTVRKQPLRTKYNLSQLERMLPPDRFIRCHRAYIVNVEAIEEIHPYFHSTFMLVMKNSSLRVPVGQKYAARFRAFLGM